MNKKLTVVLILALGASHAFAQSSSSAQQSSNSQSVAQGTIQFSQSPEHTSQTVLAAPSTALGSYAAGFSPYNCYGTKWQAGAAVPGGSLMGGAGGEMGGCQLGWLQNDYARQAAVIDAKDPVMQERDLQIATNLRCMVSSEAYDAIMAEIDPTDPKRARACHVKPKDYKPTQDTTRNPDGTQQYVTASTRVAGN